MGEIRSMYYANIPELCSCAISNTIVLKKKKLWCHS